jgi:prolyl oligopeptidase
MLHARSSRAVALVIGAAVGWSSPVAAQSLVYPRADRDAVVEDLHGEKVADPYRWLEEPDAPRTTQWLEAEGELAARYLARLRSRDAIRRRLESLSTFARTSVPWREANRLFFLRSEGRRAQPALYGQTSPNGAPRIVFDPDRFSPDGSTAIRDYAVSPDGRLLAYTVAEGGADAGVVRLRELATSRDLGETVRGALGSISWTRDGRGFYYVRPSTLDGSASEARIGKQFRYHPIGGSSSADRLLLEWPAEARWAYAMSSDDGRYEIVVAEKGAENELYAIDLHDPVRPNVAARPVRLLGDRPAFHTPIDVVGQTLYLRTSLDAPRTRVVALDLSHGASAALRTVVPETDEVIVDAVIAGDKLVVNYLADVTSRLRLFRLDGRPAGAITLPGPGAVGWPLGGRPSSSQLFFSFTSYLTPSTVYAADVRTGRTAPFHPPRVPFDASAYETRQLFYASKDGTRVPLFVTAKRGLRLDGTNPVMLTGYGGYGATMAPSYDPDVPLWLEMGGVYAVANIRGGGEYGEAWHRAGMLERKQTSFDDFIAAAEFLIAGRYTTASRLAIYGHSNGGLLVGAVVTERPDLFGAAIANAGHYDMLRFHKFTVGAGWIPEYGSPDDPAAFAWLRAYSPLHNVRAGTCYPATLLLAADHDDRVVPSHAYKFAAALQAAQACDAPILLRVAKGASHSYSSTETRVAERADMWAFVADRLGVHVRARAPRAFSTRRAAR